MVDIILLSIELLEGPVRVAVIACSNIFLVMSEEKESLREKLISSTLRIRGEEGAVPIWVDRGFEAPVFHVISATPVLFVNNGVAEVSEPEGK